MSAREKIENLTNSWYGFALFGGLFSFLQGGFGLFSALGAMGSTLLSLFLTYFFGRRLLAKGSITRLFLIVVSALGLVAWSYGAYGIGRAFINAWSFKLLFGLVYAAASVHMNFKSLRVLTDAQVKSYVG
ncbi:MAG: hypothetical protein IPK71_26665 [Myxococcales bacterium]|nr:hypothetical protein [Myxococcales bacterium]